MPSIHVPEKIAEPYILAYGGYKEAKDAMIQVLGENAPENEGDDGE